MAAPGTPATAAATPAFAPGTVGADPKTQRILKGIMVFVITLLIAAGLKVLGATWGTTFASGALVMGVLLFIAFYSLSKAVAPEATKIVVGGIARLFSGVGLFFLMTWIYQSFGTLARGLGVFLDIILLGLLLAYLAIAWASTKNKGMKIAIVVVNLVFFGMLFFAYQGLFIPDTPMYNAVDGQITLWEDVFEGIKTGGEALVEAGERQVALATGDYFTGQVDQNAERRLGVFLEGIASVSRSYYTDQPVNVYATLRAESFEESETGDPLQIDLRCYAGQEDSDKQGTVTPPGPINVIQFEYNQFDCIFPPNTLEPGTNTITMDATFDFRTNAYLKTYFMQQDRIRAYMRQGLDPLEEFKIEDRTPIAVYTPGPVLVGMGVGAQQPIAIAERTAGSISGPRLGVTLENRWPGDLKSIEEIKIILPPGLIMTSVGGAEMTGISERIISETDEVEYTLNSAWIERELKGRFEKTDLIRTFRVFTEVTSEESLLGETPLSIKNFKVSVKYKYRIKQQVDVLIKREEVVV